MAFSESFDSFLADFAVDATVSAGTLSVIFDNAHTGGLNGEVGSTLPIAEAKASDIERLGIEPGAAITIAGLGNYTVREIQPDGTGMSRMALEKVFA